MGSTESRKVTLPWQYFRDPTKNYDCGHDLKVGYVACALLGEVRGSTP